MPYHNLQQLSDAVDELMAQAGKSNEREAAFIVAQVQPLSADISQLKTDVASLKAALAAVVGTPTKP